MEAGSHNWNTSEYNTYSFSTRLPHYTTTPAPSFTCKIYNLSKLASLMVHRQMYLIWKTAGAEGKYWAFIDVEGLCKFRPVPVDDWPSILHPLQEQFDIEPWVLYENLPLLLTIEVVWEIITSELLCKGLKTRMCINIFSILEMG